MYLRYTKPYKLRLLEEQQAALEKRKTETEYRKQIVKHSLIDRVLSSSSVLTGKPVKYTAITK